MIFLVEMVNKKIIRPLTLWRIFINRANNSN